MKQWIMTALIGLFVLGTSAYAGTGKQRTPKATQSARTCGPNCPHPCSRTCTCPPGCCHKAA